MSKARVLVVDDMEDNLYLLCALLEGHGYEAAVAANGVEALESARREPPDLVISDILMPGMDGFALCREWKHDARLKSIPFVFYTATYTDEQDEAFAISLGAERFVVKPLEPEAFVVMVEEAVRMVGNPVGTRSDTASQALASPASDASPEDERAYLQHYNAALVRKLEAKMQQLEFANRVLEEDVAARQKVEKALRQSEAQLRTLVDTLPDLVWLKNPEGVYLSCNRRFESFFGAAEEEIVGKTDYDFTDAAQADLFRQHDKSALAAGGPTANEEFLVFAEDGHREAVETIKTPVHASDGRLIGVLGVSRDITGRKEAEDGLRESEERYRDILEHGGVGVAFFSVDGRFLLLNGQGVRNMGGEEASQFIGKSVVDLFGERAGGEYLARIREAAASSEAREYIDHVELPIGSRWLASIHTRSLDVQGNVTGVQVFAQDITQRMQAEEEARHHAEHLQRTVEGAVLAMSHVVESRDPYTAGHERRVAELATDIGETMGMASEKVRALRLAATIHDVGKIAVPAEILSKPGRLSETEFALIKAHPTTGCEILEDIDFGSPVAEIVRQHHERLDGSGYPQGLKGEQVTLEARILAVADVVEAMSSHRPYRPALGMEVALAEVREYAGVKYDADVVAVCVRLVEELGFQFTP
jgi:PAS domain S-box-containing protein/putative nucleotidyltransferase with HDIG domain